MMQQKMQKLEKEIEEKNKRNEELKVQLKQVQEGPMIECARSTTGCTTEIKHPLNLSNILDEDGTITEVTLDQEQMTATINPIM